VRYNRGTALRDQGAYILAGGNCPGEGDPSSHPIQSVWPLRQELLAYAGQLGLDGNAIFVGAFTHREELSRIMAETDIFVMSSILEGQPLGVVEAMAYGCPIVATSVGGIPELIEDGVNGLLAMPRDSASLAEKICTMIEDAALRLRLGRAARRSYERGQFQPESLCDHLVSIYREALQIQSFQEDNDQGMTPALER
jgi:glycosyltransferase involved in cell wall biosynthesis